MTESPVDNIRASSRNMQSRVREIHRQEELDIRRDFPSLQISKEEVLEVANKLKTKSAITAVELKILKFGLMDDKRNIKEFLNVHGAMRGLVRELSVFELHVKKRRRSFRQSIEMHLTNAFRGADRGNDVIKQCVAAGCCCNLACVDDEKTCLVVAKAAGHYLIVALSNLCSELSSISGWALGNLAAAGRQASALLQAQGAGAALARRLAGPEGDARDAALYALTHLANRLGDDLHTELLRPLLDATMAIGFTMESTRFLFILSCHDNFIISNDAHTALIFDHLRHKSIPNHITYCKMKTGVCCDIHYLFRTLANNVITDDYYTAVLDFFMDTSVMMNELMSSGGSLRTLMYWLLGNLFDHEAPNVHPYFDTLSKSCMADIVEIYDSVDFDASVQEYV